jgi:hypothetical protein
MKAEYTMTEFPSILGGVRAGIRIVLITVSVHLLGSAILFGIISGPEAMLASPLLSIFGWFFLVPELLGVSCQWAIYEPSKGERNFWRILIISVSVATIVMAAVGPKEIGDEFRWTCAYVIATAVAVTWSMFAVRFAKNAVTRPRH